MSVPEAVIVVLLVGAMTLIIGIESGASSVREECKTYHELRIDGQKYSCNISRPEGQETK